jgi:hypothetical protein
VLGAAITLFSAIVGLLGWLTTRAFNNRTEALKRTEEQRLRLDTFISALPLLDGPTANGGGARNAGAGHSMSVLFVLVELGHPDFALTMLASMWPKQVNDSEQAVSLLDRIFKKGDIDVRNDAIDVLFERADKLLPPDCGEFAWPRFLDGKR